MTPEPTSTLDRETRLNSVLLDYVEALERGETPNRYELLVANPDLAVELLEFFKGRDQLDRLAAPLREATRNLSPELGTLGDFRLQRELGRGGMGVVYEAEQISLRRRVALKVLPFAAAMDPRQLQRFQNEAQAAAHLHHPNIVPVFAVGSERGVHYYAMQFIEGQSLAALLDDLRSPSGGVGRPALSADSGGVGRPAPSAEPALTTQAGAALSTERVGRKRYFQRVAALIRQGAEALEYAHQMGIVHRDIKPANLLLDRRGELWIADFGLAQFRSDGGLTLTGEMLGTLRYASPEQSLAKRGLVDHRTDIYSLGVTLYELLTLTPVFAGRDRQELLHQIAFEEPRPPRSLIPSLPVELETIVLKAIAKNPSERYPSAREFADDLQRFLDDKPILAKRPSLLDRTTKWARRHRTLVACGVVLLLVAVVGLIANNVLMSDANQRERLKAKEAGEQRVLADKRFKQARRAVERFTQISEEELAGGPPSKARRRFLEAALVYYQEFLEDAGDEPSIQEELKESQARVSNILKELSELEGSGRFLLLVQRDVQDDLRVTPEQRKKLEEFGKLLGKEWHDMLGYFKLPAAERQQRFLETARANEAAIAGILTPEQQTRLKQIELQQHGPYGFLDPAAAALKLTSRQEERIRSLHEEMRRTMLEMDRTDGPESFGRQMTKAHKQTTQVIFDDVLTAKQREQWVELAGPAFTGTLSKGPPGPPLPPPPFPGR